MKCILIVLFSIGLFACGDLRQKHEFQGYVEGENSYLASPYSGILEKLLVSRGEQVKRGQILFQLDTEPQALQIQQSSSNLLQAKNLLKDLQQPRRLPEIEAIEAQIEQTTAQIELAQIRVSRVQELLKRNAIDKDSVDAAIANLKEQQQLKAQYESNLKLAQLGSRDYLITAQEAAVNSLTAKVAEAKWELAQKTIFAPNDGYIYDTYFREGEFVPAQQVVLSLLPPEHVRIEFFIPLSLLNSIHRGQEISFLCYYCKEKSKATITYISPEAEFIPPLVYSRDNTEKLVFRIKARIHEPNQFKPGEPVTVFLP